MSVLGIEPAHGGGNVSDIHRTMMKFKGLTYQHSGVYKPPEQTSSVLTVRGSCLRVHGDRRVPTWWAPPTSRLVRAWP